MRQRKRDWTILTSHGMVLIYLAGNSGSTVRELSDSLDITERQIARIIRDLLESGVMTVQRDGQRNSYTIDRTAPLRRPGFAHLTLGEVMDAIITAGLTFRQPE
jgi:DNA-binding MarR family transcriptional regulator